MECFWSFLESQRNANLPINIGHSVGKIIQENIYDFWIKMGTAAVVYHLQGFFGGHGSSIAAIISDSIPNIYNGEYTCNLGDVFPF